MLQKIEQENHNVKEYCKEYYKINNGLNKPNKSIDFYKNTIIIDTEMMR